MHSDLNAIILPFPTEGNITSLIGQYSELSHRGRKGVEVIVIVVVIMGSTPGNMAPVQMQLWVFMRGDEKYNYRWVY
jgi:hypothetical protein